MMLKNNKSSKDLGHKSIIIWRGEKFEFSEPADSKSLRYFFEETNKKTANFSDSNNKIRIKCEFHGAGYNPEMLTKLCGPKSYSNDIYYFPNNEPRKTSGLLDKIVNFILPHPSKQDSIENGSDAATTLAKICKNASHYTNKMIAPAFNGGSAGVNTMLHCINGFLKKCQNDESLCRKIYMLKRNIDMWQLPAAGYKGASVDNSAKLLCNIDKKMSAFKRLANVCDFKVDDKDNFDAYNLYIRDDEKFWIRLHNTKYTERFLSIINDSSCSAKIPLKIKRFYCSDPYDKNNDNALHHVDDEQRFFSDCKNGRYKNMDNTVFVECDNSKTVKRRTEKRVDGFAHARKDAKQKLNKDIKVFTAMNNGNCMFRLDGAFKSKHRANDNIGQS